MNVFGALKLSGPGSEGLRWSASFMLVLAIHGGALLSALYWRIVPERPGAPPAAVMLDLAPLPAAPEVTPPEETPAPEQAEAAPPEPVEPPPIPEPVIEPPPPLPEPEPEIALEEPEEEPEPVVEQVAMPQPVAEPKTDTKPPAEDAPPPAAPQLADRAAAPQAGESMLPPSNVVPNWQGLMLGHLERHKRYPREAQWLKQEGVVYLQFTMDRDGKVLQFKLEKSSGSDALDEEVLALIERAQPLPVPPEEVPGETLELLVPVQFSLRR